jgi:phage N-6-adenine-methyltransferase
MIGEPLSENRKKCEQKDKYGTPDKLFQKLDEEFGFTLDPCCEIVTAKCNKFYTEEDNGLTKSWKGETVFCNPPYSRGNIDLWVSKCYQESGSAIVVGLLPVSTSTKWFKKYIVDKAEIRFINKRVRFNGATGSPLFSSMIVIWGRSGFGTFDQ